MKKEKWKYHKESYHPRKAGYYLIKAYYSKEFKYSVTYFDGHKWDVDVDARVMCWSKIPETDIECPF